jgi:hypothetical protein
MHLVAVMIVVGVCRVIGPFALSGKSKTLLF